MSGIKRISLGKKKGQFSTGLVRQKYGTKISIDLKSSNSSAIKKNAVTYFLSQCNVKDPPSIKLNMCFIPKSANYNF